MPHLAHAVTEKEATRLQAPQSTRDEILAAIRDDSKDVRWQYSLFSDPGKDWEAILINGKRSGYYNEVY